MMILADCDLMLEDYFIVLGQAALRKSLVLCSQVPGRAWYFHRPAYGAAYECMNVRL